MNNLEIAVAKKVRPIAFLYDGHMRNARNYRQRAEAFQGIARELQLQDEDFIAGNKNFTLPPINAYTSGPNVNSNYLHIN